MKVVYIIGPFTGPTAWDIAENVRAAERLGLEVAKLGVMPLIPHANTALFHGQMTAEFWYDGTLELSRRCDAAITLQGWELSKGSMHEVRDLIARGVPVFFSADQLREWIKANP